MSKDDLGKTLIVSGEKQVLVGMRPAAKLDMVMRKPDGKYVAASSDYIKRLLKEAA